MEQDMIRMYRGVALINQRLDEPHRWDRLERVVRNIRGQAHERGLTLSALGLFALEDHEGELGIFCRHKTEELELLIYSSWNEETEYWFSWYMVSSISDLFQIMDEKIGEISR